MNLLIQSINIIAIFYLIFFKNIRANLIKQITLLISLILFILVIFLWINYNPFIGTYQFLYTIRIFSFNFHFGIDGFSLLFLFLTTFLFPFCILYNWNSIFLIQKEFCILILSLEIILLLLFTTNNILFFYITFELILIPLFILIGINNYRKERIHAAYLLFLYTLFGSLFMLASILLIYSQIGSLDFSILYNSEILFDRQKLIWFFLFISISIKIPIFPFHIWLPEAHVEAPTEGSVLLAGIILKLGIYGFLRILIPIFYEITIYFIPLVFTIAIISGVYTSLTTLRQIDLKKIIAYSSIAHMSIGVLGLFTLKVVGMIGSTLLMFSHGIVSGALFLLIGFLYDRFKTKIIFYYNGLIQLMPVFSFFLLLFILGNISFPGTSSFIGEFLILIDIVSLNLKTLWFIGIIMFLCTVYSLLLYNRIIFGNLVVLKLNNIFDLTRREFNIIIPFIFIMLWIGFYPNSFIELIESNIYMLYFLY